TLDGSTFLVSNPNGDIDAKPDEPEGLFFKDTRHLSKWTLTVNGLVLDVLSTDSIEDYDAQQFCVPPTGTIYKNPTLSVIRRRFGGRPDGAQPQQRRAERGIAIGLRLRLLRSL